MVQEGSAPTVHYVTDLERPVDHVVPMRPDGDVWTAEIEMPTEAEAVFYYVSGSEAEPQRFARISIPTTNKLLRKYDRSILAHSSDGKPIKGAHLTAGLMAKRQGRTADEVVAHAAREIRTYPDNFEAYTLRWQVLWGESSSESTRVKVELERAQLLARYPDSVSAWQTRVPGVGDLPQHYEQLNRRFPAHEHADEALFHAARAYELTGAPQAAVRALQGLLDRYPESPYVDEAYRQLLTALAATDLGQAEALADSLISGAIDVRIDPAQEQHQRVRYFGAGGQLPQTVAYCLQWDLLTERGDCTGATALAANLLVSGLWDPQGYHYVARRAMHHGRSAFGLEPMCAPDPGLARELLEAGLSQTDPEQLARLRGFGAEVIPGDDPAERVRRWRAFILLALGEHLISSGDAASAVPYLREAAALLDQRDGSDLETWLMLGRACENSGDLRGAEAAYLTTLRRVHSHTEAEDAIRRIHLQLHGHQDSVETLLASCTPLAPDFVVEREDGTEVSLAGLRGSTVLLSYGEGPDASWPAQLAEWAAAFGEAGVFVLHIVRDERRPLLKSPPDNVCVVVDTDDVGAKLGIRVATLFVIDRAGRIRLRRHRWDRDRATAETECKLQELGLPPSLARR